MLMDLAPLRDHREYRLLFIGQTVSFLGSMMTFVALPWQVFHLTHSSFMVGLLGSVQLVPLVAFALWGGAFADAMDRRRLLIGSEAVLTLCSLALAVNAMLGAPSVALVFVVSALMAGVNGFHRPALDSMTPRLVDREDFPAIAALGTFRHGAGAVIGPAVSGICIARAGVTGAYLVDVASFLVSLAALAAMRPVRPARGAARPGVDSILEGLRYAVSRPELVGTYVVDLIAMAFAMPIALIPEMAEGWGGAAAAGWLYAAMPLGTLAASLLSGRAGRLRRHGAGVIGSAALWGAAIVAFGFAGTLPVAVVLLAAAGAADMMSGLYRGTIWNETIPHRLRGRLAGVEMISYMTGPMVGNTRAGWVASISSIRMSICSGGAICVAGVLLCIPALPAFWRYRSAIRVPATR